MKYSKIWVTALNLRKSPMFKLYFKEIDIMLVGRSDISIRPFRSTLIWDLKILCSPPIARNRSLQEGWRGDGKHLSSLKHQRVWTLYSISSHNRMSVISYQSWQHVSCQRSCVIHIHLAVFVAPDTYTSILVVSDRGIQLVPWINIFVEHSVSSTVILCHSEWLQPRITA